MGAELQDEISSNSDTTTDYEADEDSSSDDSLLRILATGPKKVRRFELKFSIFVLLLSNT